MSPSLLHWVIVATAVCCGLVGGVFFAFSTFIMSALARLPRSQGIAAMQSINVVVINPLFLGPFFGAGVLAATTAIVGRSGPHSAALVSAACLYVFGTVFVTMFGNVPLNEQLARADADSPTAEPVWHRYLAQWTRWNHVRTAAALAASAVLTHVATT